MSINNNFRFADDLAPASVKFRANLWSLKYMIIFALIAIVNGTASGQFQDLSWFKSYGWIYLDEGVSLQETPDGGFLIAGYSYKSATGGSDVYLVKVNEAGQLEWEKFYGGASDDWANCIQKTSDGGYIIAGGTGSFDVEESDVYLLKIDSDGELIWQRTFGGPASEQASYISQTADGKFIVVGWTTSFGAGGEDIYLVKTDELGNPEWSKTFGDTYNDKAYAVHQTPDGGFVLAGGTNYFGNSAADAYLVKTNGSGDTLWTLAVGGISADAASSVIEASDSGYIFVGWTMSQGAGQHDLYIGKVNLAGELVWDKTYGGELTDVGRSIYQTFDGGYIIAGYSSSFGFSNQDVYVIRTDFKGDSLWTDLVGGSAEDYGWDVKETSDGGYAIAGWTRSFGMGSKDVLLIRYAGFPTAADNDLSHLIPEDVQLNQNYPNPFNPSTTISYALRDRQHVRLTVYDLLGRELGVLVDAQENAGICNIIFDGSNLPSGVYIYKLQAGDTYISKRMILAK